MRKERGSVTVTSPQSSERVTAESDSELKDVLSQSLRYVVSQK